MTPARSSRILACALSFGILACGEDRPVEPGGDAGPGHDASDAGFGDGGPSCDGGNLDIDGGASDGGGPGSDSDGGVADGGLADGGCSPDAGGVPVLEVDQAQVLYVRSPYGNAAEETVGARTVPAGPCFALVPSDPNAASFPADTFRLSGAAPSRLRVYGDAARTILLGTATPRANGTWGPVVLGPADTPGVHVAGVDEYGNESAPVPISTAEYVSTSNAAERDTAVGVETQVHVVRAREQDPYLTSPADRAGLRGTDAASVLVRAEPVWRPAPIDGTSPGTCFGSPLQHSTKAFDSTRGRSLLACRGRDRLVSIWEWDGARWTVHAPANRPLIEGPPVLLYDPRRNVAVLFTLTNFTLREDSTWTWDGATWTRRPGVPIGAQGERTIASIAFFDSDVGRVVVVGALEGGAAWTRAEWDGQRWQRNPMSPGGPAPADWNDWTIRGAFDPVRHVAVVSAAPGLGTAAPAGTWEMSGSIWIDRTPSQGTRGLNAPLVWDANRARVVALDQGASAEWTGSQWLALPGLGTHPTPPVLQPAYGWNPHSSTLVEYGGLDAFASPPRAGGTWEWNAAGGWVERTPTGLWPGPLLNARMVWDSLRRRIVLFGGVVPSHMVGTQPGWSSDTWTWDGRRWQRLPTAGPMPPPRMAHGMVYDSGRDRVVVFGGGYGGLTPDNPLLENWRSDTWEFDGSSWTERLPVTVPAARWDVAMGYDAVRGRTVMYGGADHAGGAARLHDTWEWDGTDWVERTAAATGAWSNGVAVFRTGPGVLSLFAGIDATHDGVWDWNGAEWLARGSWPVARGYRSRGDWDSLRGRYVEAAAPPSSDPWANRPLETREYDGTDWERRTPGGVIPLARDGATLAYDRARGRTVMYGGQALLSEFDETWEYETQADRRPGITFDASLAHARISVEQIRGLRARARCAGTAAAPDESGASLHAWAVGGFGLATADWVALTSNSAPLAETAPHVSGPGAELVWSSDSPAQARHLLRLDGLRIALQCRSRGISGPGDAAVAADYFELRVRYDASAP